MSDDKHRAKCAGYKPWWRLCPANPHRSHTSLYSINVTCGRSLYRQSPRRSRHRNHRAALPQGPRSGRPTSDANRRRRSALSKTAYKPASAHLACRSDTWHSPRRLSKRHGQCLCRAAAGHLENAKIRQYAQPHALLIARKGGRQRRFDPRIFVRVAHIDKINGH